MDSLAEPQPLPLDIVRRDGNIDSVPNISSCSACMLHQLQLCEAFETRFASTTSLVSDSLTLTASAHTIPARRIILHPAERSDFVTMICGGWAATSMALPDGRRQILSFLLPGDIVEASSLFEPSSNRLVESITEVTYRNFRRSDLKAAVMDHARSREKLMRAWIDEKTETDQLVLDLGRRTAAERIARLLLSLVDRAAKRDLVQDETMDFPLRQHHIADASGLTPVHVNKVLAQFRRSKLLEISDRLLTILDRTALRRIAST